MCRFSIYLRMGGGEALAKHLLNSTIMNYYSLFDARRLQRFHGGLEPADRVSLLPVFVEELASGEPVHRPAVFPAHVFERLRLSYTLRRSQPRGAYMRYDEQSSDGETAQDYR